MALSKEEISIRLGIDGKSVKAGLDSATGYISKWRKKQSAEERDYTSFWKSELDKRDKMEIESAARRNRARALLRERAEKRDATSSSGIGGQDTVSRSVELANSQGKGAFAKASKQLGSYAGNVISGAVMGVVATMAAAVTDLITRAVDKMSDYMSKTLYDTLEGINDRMVAYVDKQHDRKEGAKDSSKETADENAKMTAAEDRANYEKKSAEERVKISGEAMKIANEEYNLAKKKVEEAKQYQKELIKLNPGNIEATAEGLEAVAKAEAALLEARKKSSAVYSDYGKAIGDIKVEPLAPVVQSPPEVNAYAESLKKDRIAWADARSTGGKVAVDDYLSRIKSGQDAYKSKTDYSQFGKAIAEAQKEAAGKTVQKVSIVSIIEE